MHLFQSIVIIHEATVLRSEDKNLWMESDFFLVKLEWMKLSRKEENGIQHLLAERLKNDNIAPLHRYIFPSILIYWKKL